MPLRQPRRIFRADKLRPAGLPGGRTLLAGLVGAGLAGTAVLVAMSSDLFGSVPAMTGLVTAEAAQVAVVDGETLRLRETIVRLAGAAAPARGQACAAGPDCGAASSQALAGLVRHRAVSCRLQGRDGQGLALGVCVADGRELNRAQVGAGWARGAAPALAAEEAQARAAGLGIWRRGS